MGEPSHARLCFQRAVALNPALAASWKMLEGLLSAAGAADATRRLERLGQLPDAIVEAGGWFSDGDHEAARERLEAFVASQERHVEALRLLGRIAQLRGEPQRAESLLSEVVERAPGYALRGWIWCAF